jgi:hypothetical protein
MTDEELGKIRARLKWLEPGHGMIEDPDVARRVASDVSALLSDLDRSRTELAALRRGIAVVLDRAARGEDVVAALAGLLR